MNNYEVLVVLGSGCGGADRDYCRPCGQVGLRGCLPAVIWCRRSRVGGPPAKLDESGRRLQHHTLRSLRRSRSRPTHWQLFGPWSHVHCALRWRSHRSFRPYGRGRPPRAVSGALVEPHFVSHQLSDFRQELRECMPESWRKQAACTRGWGQRRRVAPFSCSLHAWLGMAWMAARSTAPDSAIALSRTPPWLSIFARTEFVGGVPGAGSICVLCVRRCVRRRTNIKHQNRALSASVEAVVVVCTASGARRLVVVRASVSHPNCQAVAACMGMGVHRAMELFKDAPPAVIRLFSSRV